MVVPGKGFADKAKTQLSYNEIGISFNSSPTPAAQVFRLNSCFDPNLTGVGHQPNTFDQYSAAYGQYCVTDFAVDIEIANFQVNPALCVAVVSDVNTSSETVENLGESRRAITKLCPGVDGNGITKMHIPKTSISVIQGEKGIRSDPNNYQLISTNPVDPVFLIFKITNFDANNVAAFVTFRITYWTEFRELTVNTESLLTRVERNKKFFDAYCQQKKLEQTKALIPPPSPLRK